MSFAPHKSIAITAKTSVAEDFWLSTPGGFNWTVLFSFGDSKPLEELQLLNAFFSEAHKRRLRYLFLNHTETFRIFNRIKSYQTQIFKADLTFEKMIYDQKYSY